MEGLMGPAPEVWGRANGLMVTSVEGEEEAERQMKGLCLYIVTSGERDAIIPAGWC